MEGEKISYLYGIQGENLIVHYELKSGSVGSIKGVFECYKPLHSFEEENDSGEIKIPKGLQNKFEEQYEGKFVPFKN